VYLFRYRVRDGNMTTAESNGYFQGVGYWDLD
jgi:hypothetical protein